MSVCVCGVYLYVCLDMSPDARAKALEENRDIEVEHEAVAVEGVLNVFVCLLCMCACVSKPCACRLIRRRRQMQ